MTIEARLDRAFKDAGLSVESVSFVDLADKATWRVQPPELQAAAQPIIDAFDVTAIVPPPLDPVAAAIEALVQHFDAMVTEHVVNGTIRQDLWRRRIRATAEQRSR